VAWSRLVPIHSCFVGRGKCRRTGVLREGRHIIAGGAGRDSSREMRTAAVARSGREIGGTSRGGGLQATVQCARNKKLVSAHDSVVANGNDREGT
jgi:hypothetical protein